MSNNFVELLLNLNVDTATSQKNINDKIKELQKNIDSLDVNLKINSSPSDNKVFRQMEEQIENLQEKIKKLESSLGSVGSKNKTSLFKSSEEDIQRTIKSIDDLAKHVKSMDGSLKIVNDETTGKIKEVVTTIESELGKLEKRVYKPVVDIGIGENSKPGLSEVTSVADEKSYSKLGKRINDARAHLEELGRVGKITTHQFDQFNNSLGHINTNQALDGLLSDLKKVNQEMSHSTKWTNAENNIKQQVESTVSSLEKMKKSLNDSYLEFNIDTTQIDGLIHKMKQMSSIKIVNDSQITEANNEFSKLSKEFSNFKNNSASFETALKGISNAIATAERQGLLASEQVSILKKELETLSLNKDLPISEKLREARLHMDRLSNSLADTKHMNKMSEEMQKAVNQTKKLSSELTKAENMFKRTINKEDVSSLRKEIERLSDVPIFTNVAQVKAYNQEMKETELQMKKVISNATTGARNSLGVIESLKIALERFPMDNQVGIKLFELLETP